MIRHLQNYIALIAFVFCALSITSLKAEDARERHMGRKVADFVLTEVTTGKPWKLAEQKAQAIVLYFNSNECPVTNRYLPSLNRLSAEMADQNVVVVVINSNQHDSADDVSKHAKEYELHFPVLSDSTGDVARSLAVTRTAEAIVLDRHFRVRYRGVIDDRFERGVTRPKATKNFLAVALNAVMSGRTVKTPMTDVEACPLNLATSEATKKTSHHLF